MQQHAEAGLVPTQATAIPAAGRGTGVFADDGDDEEDSLWVSPVLQRQQQHQQQPTLQGMPSNAAGVGSLPAAHQQQHVQQGAAVAPAYASSYHAATQAVTQAVTQLSDGAPNRGPQVAACAAREAMPPPPCRPPLRTPPAQLPPAGPDSAVPGDSCPSTGRLPDAC